MKPLLIPPLTNHLAFNSTSTFPFPGPRPTHVVSKPPQPNLDGGVSLWPRRPPPEAMQGHGLARFLLLTALALVVASVWLAPAAVGDPQATVLNLGCSTYNATPASAFLLALNSAFAGLRANLSAGGGFATAAEPRAAAPAFAMAQCRPYVAGRDCVACFDAAAARLRRSCGAANGGRVILDGCVIRYESAAFFDQATLPGNTQFCNGSAVDAGGFAGTARALVADLAAAVPNAPGLAAAAASGGVYAAAQCVETVGEGGCAQCLNVAMGNIDGCPPNSDGRAVDAGCFMRYSDKPFFPANATVDLAAYLHSGKESSRKGAIIGSIMGGLAFLFLIGLLTFLLIRRSRKLRPQKGERRGTLNWRQRFNIIVGMARGLAYLHQEFHVCIIHRDIKSSNVLLDDDFQPKIADFGLARLLPDDHSHLSTKFAGTLGYTAPEYAIHGQLSEKVDTYSFGVVVLEILSGRKSNDTKLEPETQYLLEWAWKLYESENLLALVDKSLDPEEYKPDEVKRIMEIALACTQSAVAARPMMSEVVVLLLTRNDPELQPTRPTFIDATSRVRGETSTSSSSSASKATISISQVSGR
ncbi:cysteine-rich receptor-like protein kinase 42 [Setaria italica]|uniref:cysteine-rich receptor-like protein kinase 42 n=1 Tax=Setaria italica TaxID=4555 RepID=UPI000BE5D992|nr:cysteine-rich receptor-like protein kinase 42 [Setaria italica]